MERAVTAGNGHNKLNCLLCYRVFLLVLICCTCQHMESSSATRTFKSLTIFSSNILDYLKYMQSFVQVSATYTNLYPCGT